MPVQNKCLHKDSTAVLDGEQGWVSSSTKLGWWVVGKCNECNRFALSFNHKGEHIIISIDDLIQLAKQVKDKENI